MPTVLAATLTYTLVMLVLVGLLMVARRLLVPAGPVPVLVTGAVEQRLEAEAGETLLELFTRQGFYLPAGCGGQGTCGSCRVRIEKGAARLLPTEAVHVGRGDARLGWRLACQAKVRQTLTVALPTEVLGVGRWRCTVKVTHNVSTFIREIVLELPQEEHVRFRAGSYVQVECPPYAQRFADFDVGEEYRSDWDHFGLWDLESISKRSVSRAYSLANPPSVDDVIVLNVRIATPPPESRGVPPGVASTYLFGLRPGDEVTVTGPFGDFFVRDSDAEMVFVGGGAGMAPIRSQILDQLEVVGTGRRMSFWYGARSAREAFYLDVFTRLDAEHENFAWRLALSDPAAEDYWDGDTGFIHQVLYDRHLKDHPAPDEVEYYLCGPPVMIAACLKMLDDLGVDPANILYDDFGD